MRDGSGRRATLYVRLTSHESLPLGELRCPAAVVLIPLPQLFADHIRPTSPLNRSPESVRAREQGFCVVPLAMGLRRKTMTAVARRAVPRT